MQKSYKLLACALLVLEYIMEIDYLANNEHMLLLADCYATLQALYQEWGEHNG